MIIAVSEKEVSDMPHSVLFFYSLSELADAVDFLRCGALC